MEICMSDTKIFKTIMQCIPEKLFESGIFTFSDNGIHLNMIDSSHVTIIKFAIYKCVFSSYDLQMEQNKNVHLKMPFPALKSIMKIKTDNSKDEDDNYDDKYDKNDNDKKDNEKKDNKKRKFNNGNFAIKMNKLDEDTIKFIFKSSTSDREEELKLMTYELSEIDSLDLPEIDSECRVVLSSKELIKIIGLCGTDSKLLKFKLSANKMIVVCNDTARNSYLNYDNSKKDVKIDFKPSNPNTGEKDSDIKEVEMNYDSTKFNNYFRNASGLSAYVTIDFFHFTPLSVKLNIMDDSDNGYVHLLLAPKVSEM